MLPSLLNSLRHRVAEIAPASENSPVAPEFYPALAEDTVVHTSPDEMPIAILGVPFDKITTTAAADLIDRMIASRRPHQLVTANVDFVVQAQSDVELRRILIEADLVLCDGTPLVWVSRWLGNPLPERVAGSDLVPLLIRRAAAKGHRVFFLGATPASATRAMENLRRQFPNLSAAHYAPVFRPLLEMDHDEIRQRIREFQPDILFVSLGCPKQEKWVAMHYRSLGVPVCIGVGATVDFLAGRVRRAPRWMQRSGTEWIFRLLQEPRRLLKRYAKDLVVFGWKIIGQWRRFKPAGPRWEPGPHRAQIDADGDWLRFALPRRWDVATVRENESLLRRIPARREHCAVDLSNVERLDSTGIGSLLRLRKQLRDADREFLLLAPDKKVRRALEQAGLGDFCWDLASADEPVNGSSRASAAPHSASLPGTLLWRGEITAANVTAMERATRAQLLLAWRDDWVIDLSAVRFIDSSGANLMRRLKQWTQDKGAPLAFIHPPPALRNVLRHAHLENLLQAEPETPATERGAASDLAVSQT